MREPKNKIFLINEIGKESNRTANLDEETELPGKEKSRLNTKKFFLNS